MKTQFQSALKEAMKARDQVRVETIRSILSALDYEALQKGVEDLPEPAVLEIIKRELKKRAEEAEFVEKAGRAEQITRLKQEVAVLESFLPQQLTSEQLSETLKSLKASDPSLNMGGAMKLLKERFPSQYDAKAASELAKQIFS